MWRPMLLIMATVTVTMLTIAGCGGGATKAGINATGKGVRNVAGDAGKAADDADSQWGKKLEGAGGEAVDKGPDIVDQARGHFDPDGDFVRNDNGEDNCPLLYNRNQADFDGDGEGDRCDLDIDGDLRPNPGDNYDWDSSYY